MVGRGVIATSYWKNCFWTRTVGIDKPMKRTGHSQIHLLEKEWSDPEQVSSLLKLLLIISISKREGHDKLRRCSKISINWPNAQVSWRWGWLMQNRKSTLHGLNAGIFPSTLTYHHFWDPNWVCKTEGLFWYQRYEEISRGSAEHCNFLSSALILFVIFENLI